MTTATAPAFPIDGLLTCAICEGELSLTHDREPRYRCRSSCSTSFAAGRLNRLLIAEITDVVITDATFPWLKDHFAQDLAESGDRGEPPADEELRRLVTDPETFLADEAMPEAAALLAKFVRRIRLDAEQATIQYALALPAGSALAGSRRQEIKLPESVTA